MASILDEAGSPLLDEGAGSIADETTVATGSDLAAGSDTAAVVITGSDEGIGADSGSVSVPVTALLASLLGGTASNANLYAGSAS